MDCTFGVRFCVWHLKWKPRHCARFSYSQDILRFAFFWSYTVYGPPNSVKCRFLSKFRSHSTIYIFKNYFTTAFLTINFQFSINKRYLNKSLFKKILQILPYKGTLVTQLLVCVWIALTMRFCIWSRTRLHYALMHI